MGFFMKSDYEELSESLGLPANVVKNFVQNRRTLQIKQGLRQPIRRRKTKTPSDDDPLSQADDGLIPEADSSQDTVTDLVGGSEASNNDALLSNLTADLPSATTITPISFEVKVVDGSTVVEMKVDPTVNATVAKDLEAEIVESASTSASVTENKVVEASSSQGLTINTERSSLHGGLICAVTDDNVAGVVSPDVTASIEGVKTDNEGMHANMIGVATENKTSCFIPEVDGLKVNSERSSLHTGKIGCECCDTHSLPLMEVNKPEACHGGEGALIPPVTSENFQTLVQGGTTETISREAEIQISGSAPFNSNEKGNTSWPETRDTTLNGGTPLSSSDESSVSHFPKLTGIVRTNMAIGESQAHYRASSEELKRADSLVSESLSSSVEPPRVDSNVPPMSDCEVAIAMFEKELAKLHAASKTTFRRMTAADVAALSASDKEEILSDINEYINSDLRRNGSIESGMMNVSVCSIQRYQQVNSLATYNIINYRKLAGGFQPNNAAPGGMSGHPQNAQVSGALHLNNSVPAGMSAQTHNGQRVWDVPSQYKQVYDMDNTTACINGNQQIGPFGQVWRNSNPATYRSHSQGGYQNSGYMNGYRMPSRLLPFISAHPPLANPPGVVPFIAPPPAGSNYLASHPFQQKYC
ncbi:unnamed protein product [Hermetia illucens]|uniref:Uncharacterized protein n=1 Tax=Hermetia illucens TaxID=343691 RepID=A0A7R8YS22_HERIL|nr:unnamed protein product [Hermetia illucens]